MVKPPNAKAAFQPGCACRQRNGARQAGSSDHARPRDPGHAVSNPHADHRHHLGVGACHILGHGPPHAAQRFPALGRTGSASAAHVPSFGNPIPNQWRLCSRVNPTSIAVASRAHAGAALAGWKSRVEGDNANMKNLPAARPGIGLRATKICRTRCHCSRLRPRMSPAASPTCNGSPGLAKAAVPVPRLAGEGPRRWPWRFPPRQVVDQPRPGRPPDNAIATISASAAFAQVGQA